MNEGFIEALKRFSFLNLSDLAKLFKLSSFQSFKAGELIVEEGSSNNRAFLVTKGIIRTYVIRQDGEERTIKLAKEKQFISDSQGFLKEQPSTEYLEALEDCKVICFDIRALNALAKENIRILRLLHEGVKEAFLEAIDRVEFFTVLTPEQRYQRLLTESPDLIQRVPQKYLASYLGVTTVSLSRIRKRTSL